MAKASILIHAGFTKTGSTAIQNYAGAQQSSMRGTGLCYLPHAGHAQGLEVGSGNGTDLFQRVQEGDGKGAKDAVLSVTVAGGTALVSSEAFSSLTLPQWEFLKRCLAELDVELLKIVCLVRNPLPYLASAYAQGLKMHGECKFLEGFMPHSEWMHYDAARTLLEVFPRDQLTFLHYDSIEGNLLGAFFDAAFSVVDPPYRPGDAEYPSLRVNRSLSLSESHYVRMLNESIGGQFGAEFAERLMKLKVSPTLSRFYSYQVSLLIGHWLQTNEGQPLWAAYSNQVAWMNQNCFGGRLTVSLEKPIVPAMSPQLSAELEQHEKDVGMCLAEFTCDKMSRCRLSAYSEYSRRLIDAWLRSGQLVNTESVPGFDAFHYAIMNPDVICAGWEPLAHYMEHGKKEQRPSSLEESQPTSSQSV